MSVPLKSRHWKKRIVSVFQTTFEFSSGAELFNPFGSCLSVLKHYSGPPEPTSTANHTWVCATEQDGWGPWGSLTSVCVCVSVCLGGGVCPALDLHPGCPSRRQMQPLYIPDVAAFIGWGGSALSSWQPSLVIGWPEIIRFLLGKRIEKTTKSSLGTQLKASWSPFLQHAASAIPFSRCYSFVCNPNKCHRHSRENDSDWHWDNEI